MFDYINREIESTAFAKWLYSVRNRNSTRALFVHGARQIGKTTTIRHVAKDNFKNVYYINLIENTAVNTSLKQRRYSFDQKPIPDLISLWTNSRFIDSPDSVIIFDEVQAASEVYGQLRLFTRELKANVIITGSYLGHIARDSTFIPAGDTFDVYMTGFQFSEFLKASGYDFLIDIIETNLASQLPFSNEIHKQLLNLFSAYLSYGGYPEVVLNYLHGAEQEELVQILDNNIERFCEESMLYIKNTEDKIFLKNVIYNIPKLILTREEITTKVSKVTELINGIDRSHNKVDSKAVRMIIGWLLEAHMITQSYRCYDFSSASPLVGEGRIYLRDSGLANEILGQGTSATGIITEGYICTILEDMFSENLGTTPKPICFLEEKGLEIDFYVNSIYGKTAIEVKAGSNMKNIDSVDLLRKKKIDFIIRTGTSNLGKEGDILTVPLYAFSFLKLKDKAGLTFFQSRELNEKNSLNRMNLFD